MNLNKLMKQAQKMQEQMAKTQSELAEKTVEVEAGGGKVKVIANGAGEVLSIPEILEHPQITERSLIKHFQTTPGTDREIAVVRAGFRLVTGDPVPGLSTRCSPPTLKKSSKSSDMTETPWRGLERRAPCDSVSVI